MNGPLTVGLAELTDGAHRTDVTLASLPISFESVDLADTVDVVIVDGNDGWAVRVEDAFARGARVVVLIEPTSGESIGHNPGPVIVDRVYAGNPAVAGLPGVLADLSPSALLEIRATVKVGAHLGASLHGLLALARTSTNAELIDAQVVARSRGGLVVRGRQANGRPVLLTVTVTDAVPEGVSLRVIDAHAAVEAEIPSASTARPAIVTVADEFGRRQLPTLYETSHRAALRRARDVIHRIGNGDDLSAVCADATLADRLINSTTDA
ncbi:hypothetical protein GCM10027568_33820 [Humibacter soli]